MVESPAITIDEVPWEAYAQTPTVHGRIHILAPRASATFNPRTYPSLEIEEHSGEDVRYASMIVSLTGTAEERRAFADELHAVADAIAAWTEADGRAPEAVA